MNLNDNAIRSLLEMLMRETTFRTEALSAGEMLWADILENPSKYGNPQPLQEDSPRGKINSTIDGNVITYAEIQSVVKTRMMKIDPKHAISHSESPSSSLVRPQGYTPWAYEYFGANLKPGTAKDYQDFLNARAKNGLRATKKWNYPFSRGLGGFSDARYPETSRLLWVCNDNQLKVPAQRDLNHLFGIPSKLHIIMTHTEANVIWPDFAYSTVLYFMKNGRAETVFGDEAFVSLPEYTDVKMPQKGNRDDQALDDFLYGRPAGK